MKDETENWEEAFKEEFWYDNGAGDMLDIGQFNAVKNWIRQHKQDWENPNNAYLLIISN